MLNQGQQRVLLPQPSSDLPLLTAHSFIYLVELVFVYACMYGLLNFACFPTVLWWQEFEDKMNLSPFLRISGTLEILCFMVVAMYIFVAWLVLQLLVEEDTRMSSLLQVCVGFGIART